jgi:hypothetical protein
MTTRRFDRYTIRSLARQFSKEVIIGHMGSMRSQHPDLGLTDEQWLKIFEEMEHVANRLSHK